jgi:hypothetical protein
MSMGKAALKAKTEGSGPQKKRATYQDVINAPEHMVAEIVGGVLHTHPRPRPAHAFAATSLSDEITSPFQKGRGGPGGWIILMEPELHLGEHVLVPDIAGWRRKNLPKLPETAWFETPPDWVCEILSPSTARLDRVEKSRIYAEFQIPHMWLVDPDAKTLEVFELQRKKGLWLLTATYADDAEVTAPPFAELPLNLGELWA